MQAQQSAPQLPALKQLVLVGGGHSHLAVLSAFARRPVPGVRLVLVSEETMTGYSGMLPGLIAGQYEFEDTHIDLRRLCEASGVVFLQDRVTGLDIQKKTIHCAQRGQIYWDWLSINVGSTPDVRKIKDPARKAIGVKPIVRFLAEVSRIERRLRTEPHCHLSIGVIGAGAAGVEVALSLEARLSRQFPEARFGFHLLGADAVPTPAHNTRVQHYLLQCIQQREITFHPNFRVADISEAGVTSDSGQFCALDEVVLVTGSMPQDWLGESGLAVDKRGFVRVNDSLQSFSHPDVFAAGDIASMDGYSLEKAGVFAVRQGKPLAANLRSRLLGRKLKRYKPQAKWLAILNEGSGSAVASKGAFFAAGAWVWRWKDYIDRKFMRMYQDMNAIEPVKASLPESLKSDGVETLLENLSMRCSGCGSKVGASVLSASLSRLDLSDCSGIEGLQAADDAAIFSVPAGKKLVQSVDYFTAPLDDPFVVGELAAVHALSDVHAMGAEPHSALAMVTLPLASRAIMGEVLDQVLAGAVSVFQRESVCLAGGHTTEGDQLSVGFVVNGILDDGTTWTKNGVQSGDAIILTKPLGSGILLAGHHSLRAKGDWLDSALEQMLVSNGGAAAVLADFPVHACTDVTGFGLMGHLAEMLKGASVDLVLAAANLPVYAGVEALTQAGVRSSLYQENLSSRHLIANLGDVADKDWFPVLFDPQTAGGLLFSVPFEDADACINALQKSGVRAACLGHARAGKGEVIWD